MSKVKAIFRCPEEYKKEFAKSNCLLTISVGQASHENELFEATIEKINETFASCTLLVDDILQRHTMAIFGKKSPENYYNTAIKEGDLWLERNRKYYDKLTIPLKIVRWQKWLAHPEFQSKLKMIKYFIESDLCYKHAVDKSIDGFLKKLNSRMSKPECFDWERARQLSYDFVTEECAALCLWHELQCEFEIYPLRHNDAINETRKKFVLIDYPKLLRAVNVIFRNAKQMKSQQFTFLQDVV